MVYFTKDIIFQVSMITDSWISYVWMRDLCVCFCVYMCTYLHMQTRCVGPSLVTFHVVFWVRVSLTPDLSSWQVWLDRERVSPVSTQLWGGICAFCVCAREANLCCHTYTSTLPTEPSSQSWFSFFLWMNNFLFLVIFYLSTGLSANMSITRLDCCMFKWTSEYR